MLKTTKIARINGEDLVQRKNCVGIAWVLTRHLLTTLKPVLGQALSPNGKDGSSGAT